jgi:hypothetical protein
MAVTVPFSEPLPECLTLLLCAILTLVPQSIGGVPVTEPFCQGTDRGIFEQVDHGDSGVEALPNLLVDLQHQQGMTAQIEEMVIAAHVLPVQDLLPNVA